ncbi:GYF domain-containing protein [Prosthecobacter sp. SYSU 5D2]|uniref:GYF domain-containing protein n=1 Tax=Prosthecobacter sp. SYSU 5D2 TaxID=3134134 RepID=UPI0031FEC3F3
MNPYFVAPNGQQQGPYSLKQLEDMMRSGHIKDSDLCWREGMRDWQSISTAIPSLLVTANSDPLNPYAPPTSPWETAASRGVRNYYGGIGRLAYFGISFVLGIANAFLATMTQNQDAMAGFVILILVVVASVVTVFQRLKNIGMNPWWCLLMFIPIANLFIGFRCLACQEGYANIGRLDTAGKIIAWIFGLLLLLMVFAIGVTLVAAK